jgi:hypothetical protein
MESRSVLYRRPQSSTKVTHEISSNFHPNFRVVGPIIFVLFVAAIIIYEIRLQKYLKKYGAGSEGESKLNRRKTRFFAKPPTSWQDTFTPMLHYNLLNKYTSQSICVTISKFRNSWIQQKWTQKSKILKLSSHEAKVERHESVHFLYQLVESKAVFTTEVLSRNKLFSVIVFCCISVLFNVIWWSEFTGFCPFLANLKSTVIDSHPKQTTIQNHPKLEKFEVILSSDFL